MSSDLGLFGIRSGIGPAGEGPVPADRQQDNVRVAFAQKAEEKKDLKPEELEKMASEVQIYLKRLNTELRFEVDSGTKDVIIKIIDPETEEVIRQMPSEELIAIRKRMNEILGVLYDSRT